MKALFSLLLLFLLPEWNAGFRNLVLKARRGVAAAGESGKGKQTLKTLKTLKKSEEKSEIREARRRPKSPSVHQGGRHGCGQVKSKGKNVVCNVDVDRCIGIDIERTIGYMDRRSWNRAS